MLETGLRQCSPPIFEGQAVHALIRMQAMLCCDERFAAVGRADHVFLRVLRYYQ